MGIYGNVSFYQPHTKFRIYRSYRNRAEMIQKVEKVEDEELFDDNLINSYVLVDYSMTRDSSGGETTYSYTDNLNEDKKKFQGVYDLTVWQVRLINDFPRCIAIARLHSVLPTFEIEGSYKFDLLPAISAGDYFGQGKNDHV